MPRESEGRGSLIMSKYVSALSNDSTCATVKQEFLASANKGDGGLADEVYKLKHDILDQLSKPQYRKVTHDLTTKT